MDFIIISELLITLAAALLVGELFEQIRLPAVAGEILSGMIIGPTLLGLVTPNDSLNSISSIALFFIIFHIGFEVKTQMVKGKIMAASILSVTSFLLPLILTTVASLVLFQFGFQANIVIALAISVPSISIVSVLVIRYNLLHTSTGQLILASVTISDVISFIILAAVVSSLRSTLAIIVETFIFIVSFVVLDWILNSRPAAFQQFLEKASKLFKREDFAYAFLIIAALTVAVIFQRMGLSYILGAFFAGLIVHDGLIGRKAFDRISQTLSTMNAAFFIPLFFGFAGLEVSLQGISGILYVKLAVLIASALAVGVSVTYYVSKKLQRVRINLLPKQVAAILGGRGAIGIVIATVALNMSLLNETGFSLIILATLIMSLAIPFITGNVKKQPTPEAQEATGPESSLGTQTKVHGGQT
jgi:Kef-type K+ transport system membrane component KefB